MYDKDNISEEHDTGFSELNHINLSHQNLFDNIKFFIEDIHKSIKRRIKYVIQNVRTDHGSYRVSVH